MHLVSTAYRSALSHVLLTLLSFEGRRSLYFLIKVGVLHALNKSTGLLMG